MTPVYKLSASSIKGRTNYGSMLAGNAAFVPPSYESIATVSVGSGGATSAEFTSIPQTYAHLQIRAITRSTRAIQSQYVGLQINNDTGSNYKVHILEGNGAAASSLVDGTTDKAQVGYAAGANASSNIFGVSVIDILDYTSTNKNKTLRGLCGIDVNGATGYANLHSGLYFATPAAITSIKLLCNDGNLAQYSHFALYGIKGAA